MNNPRYPLGENEAGALRSASERPFQDITFERAVSGELKPDDLRIHADTLRAQADIARRAGYSQLAQNLLRAAELTVVPNEELLKTYNLLRPNRATYQQLLQLAERLETTYSAVENARFVREIAETYRTRGILFRES